MGKAVLDPPPVQSSFPKNLVLLAPFKSYDELPLCQCDGWLYTSGWDGIPTLLIDLAYEGVPIVASAVEGVRELIGPQTGWPIDDWEEPTVYVAAINDMLASPRERIQRAKRLQEAASEAHSMEQFNRDVAELFWRSER